MHKDGKHTIRINSISEPFVASAVVAAKLYQIIHITTQLKLSALNAQIITARAGATAQGFRPLTSFITELADKTSEIIEIINKEALSVSKSSITSMRQEKVAWAIDHAHGKHQQETDLTQNEADFKNMATTAETELQKVNDYYYKQFNSLHKLLNDIEQNIKSASYLGANCRIEAAHIDLHRKDFEAVAQNIESSAQEIKKIVHECQQLLKRNIRK